MSSPSHDHGTDLTHAPRPGVLGAVLDFILDFHNKTVMFRVGNWVVTTYSLLAGIAFFVGFSLGVWFSAMTGLDPVRTAQFYLFFLTPAILLGLRSFSIMLEWRELFKNPLATLIKPGYMLHGGIFGAVMGYWGYSAVTGIPMLRLLDAAAFAMPLGEAIARLGCYVYGCCWGRPTNSRFGVRYTSRESKVVRCAPHLHGVKIHPAQIYALVAHLLLFAVLYAILPYKSFDGMITGIYLISHGLIRFGLEMFRQDDRGRLFGPLTHTNLYSIIGIVGGAVALAYGAGWGLQAPADMSIRWIHIVTDSSLMPWLPLIGLVFGLAYGVHYKNVGSWITSKSHGMGANVDELSMGAAQRLDRVMRGQSPEPSDDGDA